MGKKKTARRWDMFTVPAVRESTAQLYHADAEKVSDAREAYETHLLARGFATSPIIWADKEFTAYSLDAARDAPDMLAFQPPLPRGLLALARPLPPIQPSELLWSHRPDEPPAPVHAVWWSMTQDTLMMAVLTHDIRFQGPPGSHLWMLRHLTFGDESSVMTEQLMMSEDPASEPVLIPLHHLKCLGLDDFVWLRWLAVAWELLREPRVTSSRELDLATGAKPAAGVQRDPAQVMQIKSIRPMEQKTSVPAQRGAGEGREFSKRWVVRGHWRQQAVGQGRSERRATWIPSHIKGPPGAPLVRPDVVWRWSDDGDKHE